MAVAALSDTIQARLRELAEAFVVELPGRMQEVTDGAAKVTEHGATRDDVEWLRDRTHRLAGSAATFGFHRVTACAKRLEHHLDQMIEQDLEIDADVCSRIRPLVSDLVEAARIRPPDGPEEELEELDIVDDAVRPGAESFPAPGAGGDRRTVIVLLESDETAALLCERFSFYGFQATALRDPRDLETALAAGRHTALVADVDFITRDGPLRHTIRAAVEASEGKLHVVYVSERDDFAIRLLAVRAAGAAFFTLPLDVHRIVDSIDGLTANGAGEPYHIMIVDDDKEQMSHYALLLQQAGMITSVVSEPNQLFAVLIESKPDLILMDMYMPGCSGPELATMIRQQEAFVGVPIVFLSIETDQDKQFAAVGRGGDGFLCKPIKPEHLVMAVTNRVERTRSMRFFMERDSLTGLLNHTHLMESLSAEVQRAERVDRPVCFAMIDLDHFKRVNDLFGHLTGDRVLRTLGRRLVDRLRKTDVIGRYGGEEFGIVMFNVDAENAVRILDSIREDFGHIVHEAGKRRFTVTFSAGVAAFPTYDGPGPISEAADRALYLAKARGRNRVISI